MHHAARSRIAACSIALALATAATTAAQVPSPSPAIPLRVVEQRTIEIPQTRIISMSPDGHWLVADRAGDELCVFAIDTLEERACATLEALDAGIRLDDVVWSPDSRYVAFTERALQTLQDGDLWLMDATSGTLLDIDDDGFTGTIPILRGAWPADPITLPSNPAFSPDGRLIAFSRTTFAGPDSRSTTIATVPVAGGPAQDLFTVSDEIGVVYFGMGWAPDASRIYYSVQHLERDDLRNGVWVVDADGSDPRLLVPRFQPDGAGPALLDVSADGRTLLLFDPDLAAGRRLSPGVYATADAESGIATPLAPISLPAPATVGWAGLSPDGRYLLTLYRYTEPDGQVWVRDVAGTMEVPLLPSGLESVGPIETGTIPSWSATGLLFLNGGFRFGQGTLLTIHEVGRQGDGTVKGAA